MSKAERRFEAECDKVRELVERMGAIQAVEYLDGLLCASDERTHAAIKAVRDRIQWTLKEWSNLTSR